MLNKDQIVDCFQRNKPIPPEVLSWSDRAARIDNHQAMQRQNQLFQIIGRLCSLRSICLQPGAGSLTCPTILTLAKGIDADLIDFINTVPGWLRYTTKPCKTSDNVLTDYYHVYPNTWIVAGYNMARSARIMTHELILQWVSHNPAHENRSIQRRESEMALAGLNADICATVPYILGDLPTESQTSILPRAAAGMGLLCPLYLAATMDTVSQRTRAWVITRFDKLGHLMGIQQAVTLANVLRTKRHITAWDRFEIVRMDDELQDW